MIDIARLENEKMKSKRELPLQRTQNCWQQLHFA